MTEKEKYLVYLCGTRPKTLRMLVFLLHMNIVDVEKLVKRCEKYLELDINDQNYFKSRCKANLEGKLLASDYKNQYFRWYYPMAVSTIALIISIIALVIGWK